MTEEEIHETCRKYEIENYTINADGSIDVSGDVDLSGRQLAALPLQFRHVSGTFYCHNNKLISLQGSPTSVGSGFTCSNNQLTTLQNSPKTVGGFFSCDENQLTSLQGVPTIVGGQFLCIRNPLIPYDTRYILLSIIGGNIGAEGELFGILGVGRVNGVMPSELIPGKIRQLKELS